MRKYLFNIHLLSAVFGAIGLAKTTASGPRDWKLLLLWLGWGINVAVAAGTIADQARQDELENGEW